MIERRFPIRIVLVSAVSAIGLAACATDGPAAPPVTYTVVKADDSIPFASTGVRNFRVGKDEPRSLLLEGPNRRWYRATLDASCRSSLPWEHAIGVKTDATDRFDRFSTVIIDGRRCQIRALDQIADPDGVPAPATPQTP